MTRNVSKTSKPDLNPKFSKPIQHVMTPKICQLKIVYYLKEAFTVNNLQPVLTSLDKCLCIAYYMYVKLQSFHLSNPT